MIAARLEQACLIAAIALPLIGAALVKARGEARGGIAVSWASAATSLLLLVLVAARGSVDVTVGGSTARPLAGLVANPVSTSLLVLICGVGALVQSFQARYLQADSGAERFAARALLVVAAMAAVTASATVAELILAWVGAGAAFVSVLAYRRDVPGITAAIQAASRSLLLGDGCLLAAGVLVWQRAGDVSLVHPEALAQVGRHLGDGRYVVATLVIAAALTRCAQGVFRRWLSLTISSPTPGSALLHAGVVNGGGILMIRLGPLATWTPAAVGLLAVSAGTAVWAGAVMQHHPDVKGRLAASTASQMGFMLAEIAVGAWPAAVIHMIGHGLYKSSMFFSSGSAIRLPGALATAPATLTIGRIAAGTITASAAAAALVPGVVAGDGLVPALYAGAGAAFIGASWSLHRPHGAMRWIWPAGLVMIAGAYGGVVAAMVHFLRPALPWPSGLGAAWLLVPAVAAMLLALLARAGRWGTALRLQLLQAGTRAPLLRRSGLHEGLARARSLPALVRVVPRESEAA